MADMTENQIHEELAALDNTWKDTAPAKGGSNIPDDDYVAKISKMIINKSKKGRLQVVTTFTIFDGNYTGKEIMRFDGLDNEQSMSFFKAMCETIGLEYPESLVQLPDAIKAFTDSFDGLINITMKTKGDYQNLYIKGLVNYE